jgi:hypothetical protein
MSSFGYSGKPIWQKLGISPETRVRLVAAPENYMQIIDLDIRKQVVKSGEADLTHCFVSSQQELTNTFPKLISLTAPGGCIWISWYKKSAGIPTDLTEDIIRTIILPTGWVDVKVCAVSEQWSGLKIMKRKK